MERMWMLHSYVSTTHTYSIYRAPINWCVIIICPPTWYSLKLKLIKVRTTTAATWWGCVYIYVYVIYVCMYVLGGSSTKLSFQSLNRDYVNSVHHVMPVGMYEGIGEEYTILHHVFKPIFDQLLTFTQSFTSSSSALVSRTPPISSIPPQCQLPTMLYESETPIQLNSSNTFISPSCTTCKQLCDQHHLHSTPLHSPLSLQNASMAQVVIAADMPMLRMLIGCQTSAKCHNFCPICLVNRDDVEPGRVHSPVILSEYKEYAGHSRNTFPPRTTASQHHQYQSFITGGHGNIDDAKYYGNVIHPPLISTEIHQHLDPLPLHILLGTTKKAIDILTNMCIEHDTLMKDMQGDTRDDTSLRDREILSSIQSAQNIQLFTVSISTHHTTRNSSRSHHHSGMSMRKQYGRSRDYWNKRSSYWHLLRKRQHMQGHSFVSLTTPSHHWMLRDRDIMVVHLSVMIVFVYWRVPINWLLSSLLGSLHHLMANNIKLVPMNNHHVSWIIDSSPWSPSTLRCSTSIYVVMRLLAYKPRHLATGILSISPIKLSLPRCILWSIICLSCPVVSYCWYVSEQARWIDHNIFNKLGRQYVYLSSDVKRMQAMMNRCIRIHDPRVLQHVPSRKQRSKQP